MKMLKTLDPEIRKLSASGIYYKDMATVLDVGEQGLCNYMKEKGIPRNLKRKSRTGDE